MTIAVDLGRKATKQTNKQTCLTERLLMGRKESNQTKQKNLLRACLYNRRQYNAVGPLMCCQIACLCACWQKKGEKFI